MTRTTEALQHQRQQRARLREEARLKEVANNRGRTSKGGGCEDVANEMDANDDEAPGGNFVAPASVPATVTAESGGTTAGSASATVNSGQSVGSLLTEYSVDVRSLGSNIKTAESIRTFAKSMVNKNLWRKVKNVIDPDDYNYGKQIPNFIIRKIGKSETWSEDYRKAWWSEQRRLAIQRALSAKRSNVSNGMKTEFIGKCHVCVCVCVHCFFEY